MPSTKTSKRAPKTAAAPAAAPSAAPVKAPPPVEAKRKTTAKPRAPAVPPTAKHARAARKAAPDAASKKAVSTKTAPVKEAEAPQAPKLPRPKLVRDGFTMPEADFGLIAMLKARAIDAKRPAKKSELLRAGLRALMDMPAAELVAALAALEPIKTGRPKKGH